MKNVKLSISAMLDDFFSGLRKEMGASISQTVRCSRQAFSKARAGISHTIKRETDGIIDETVNKKQNKHSYQTNMNELVGCISRHFPEYMEADTRAEKRAVIQYIFSFAISTRVRDKKGCGEPHPRKEPCKVKNHYNNKTTH